MKMTTNVNPVFQIPFHNLSRGESPPNRSNPQIFEESVGKLILLYLFINILRMHHITVYNSREIFPVAAQ